MGLLSNFQTHTGIEGPRWGLIWMWHSLVLLCVSLLTNLVAARQIMTDRWSFFLLWAGGIGAWGIVYWAIRRRDGPVSFVERQIAHAWAAGLIMILLVIPLEAVMDLRPLQLSHLIAGCIGMVFMVATIDRRVRPLERVIK